MGGASRWRRILAWCLQFRRHRRESDGHGRAWRDRRVARCAWCLPIPGYLRGRAVYRPGHRAAEPCRVLLVRSAGTWPSGPNGGRGYPHRGGDLRLAARSRPAGAQSAGGVIAAVEPDAGRPGKPGLHPDGPAACWCASASATGGFANGHNARAANPAPCRSWPPHRLAGGASRSATPNSPPPWWNAQCDVRCPAAGQLSQHRPARVQESLALAWC